MQSLLLDLRFGARTLRKSPGATAAAILSLALGIGANVSVFSYVNAIFLRPLPVANPAGIVGVYTSDANGVLYSLSSYPDYLDFRDRNGVLTGLAAYSPTSLSLRIGTDTERVFAETVSGNYFSVLGIPALHGRTIVPDDDRVTVPEIVAVMSYGVWQRRFGGLTSVIGRTVTLSGQPVTIVGIAPPGFTGLMRGLDASFWVPLQPSRRLTLFAQAGQAGDWTTERGTRSLLSIGRLKPDVSIEQARAAFAVIGQQLFQEQPEHWRDGSGRGLIVSVLPENLIRVFPAARGVVVGFLALLMTIVGLVLLVACVNVAGLLLARGATRHGEIALRMAFGARRSRLVRQLLTESLLLSGLGGLAGLLVAAGLTRAMEAFRPPLSVPVALEAPLDLTVLLGALILTILTGLIFGVGPSLRGSDLDLAQTLKGEAGLVVGGRRRLREVFVAGQLAVSVLLAASAGLFMRSLQQVGSVSLGFDPSNVLMMTLEPALQGYTQAESAVLCQEALERVSALPGVVAAGFAQFTPFGFVTMKQGVMPDGYVAGADEDMEVTYNLVSPGYFQALKIDVVEGRAFERSDGAGASGVAVVNQAFAARYWPGQDPIGKRLRLTEYANESAEVIGVTRTGKYVTMGETPMPYLYLPTGQHGASSLVLFARTASEPGSLRNAVLAAVRATDPDLPVFDIRTMTEQLALSLVPMRLAGWFLAAFGGLAVLLAAIGVHGVMAYSVARRTHEFGVRIALGADRAAVLRLVLWEGARVALGGLAVGIGAALALTRVLRGLLYGISPTDPLTFVATALLLAVVAGWACYVPARRAARVEPVVALRHP